MEIGTAQKSCTALLLLWSLRKNDISKKLKYNKETLNTFKGILIYKQRKNKNKKYTYADYALTLIVFYLIVTIDIYNFF